MSDNQDFEQLAKLGEQNTEVGENGLPTLRSLRGIITERNKETVEESWGMQHSGYVLGRVKRFEYMQVGFDLTGYIIHGSKKLVNIPNFFDKSGLDANLDSIGDAGWELCAATPCRQNCTDCTDYYFKREIKDS